MTYPNVQGTVRKPGCYVRHNTGHLGGSIGQSPPDPKIHAAPPSDSNF
jgi:hypothetical protein